MEHCKQSMPVTPYERLSGQAGIARVLDDYYRLLRSDPQFRTLYIKLKQMRPQQTLFLMQIAGGPIREADRLVEYAHAGLRVEHEQYTAMMSYLGEALRLNGLPEQDVHCVVAQAEAMRKRIVSD